MVAAVSSTTDSSTSTSQTTSEKVKTEGVTAFSALFSNLINVDKGGSVNEEELFAGIVHERIKAIKGDATATKYQEELSKAKDQLRKPNGYVSYEEASVAALKSLRSSGDLTEEEGDKIYSESFAAAQIDTNASALWDGRGGKGDPTIAVATMESALANAQLLVQKIASGEQAVDAKTLNGGAANASSKSVSAAANSSGSVSTASGTTMDGPDGFLFKPVSNNDGNLAVLLPELLAHKVTSLVIKDPTGNILEEGHSTGYGDLGTREKYSFSKPGAEYPDNLQVVATLEDGSTKIWQIDDPAKRYD